MIKYYGVELVAVHDRPLATELGGYYYLIECANCDYKDYENITAKSGLHIPVSWEFCGEMIFTKKRNIAFAFLIVTTLFSGCAKWKNPEPAELEPVKYVYAKDGDTIGVTNMSGESLTVRLIGIDAPESVAPESYTEKTGKENNEYGEKAAEHLTLMLKDCDLIYLEYDQEMTDSYDRVLAYVHLTDSPDITNTANYRMLDDGYAITMEIAPNVKYCKELLEAEKGAMNAGRGLWGLGAFEAKE